MLQQREQAVGRRSAGRLVAGDDQEHEEQRVLHVVQLATVHLRLEQHAGQAVGRVRPLAGRHLCRIPEELRRAFQGGLGSRSYLGILIVDERVAQLVEPLAVLGRHAHQLTDRPHRDACRDICDELTACALAQFPDHPGRLELERVGEARDHPGGERLGHYVAELTVLRRVHADDHHADLIQPVVRWIQPQWSADPARELLGRGRDLLHVLVTRQCPEARAVGLLVPVHGTLTAQLVEPCMRCSLLPYRCVGEVDVLEGGTGALRRDLIGHDFTSARVGLDSTSLRNRPSM